MTGMRTARTGCVGADDRARAGAGHAGRTSEERLERIVDDLAFQLGFAELAPGLEVLHMALCHGKDHTSLKASSVVGPCPRHPGSLVQPLQDQHVSETLEILFLQVRSPVELRLDIPVLVSGLVSLKPLRPQPTQ